MKFRLKVAEELAKLTNISEDRADDIIDGFLSGDFVLSHMREYWNAEKKNDPRKAAKVVKKYWM